MKKTLILLIMFIGSSLQLMAQVGESFPQIKGETVTDKKIRVPDDTRGKYTLIGMAFSRQSEEELQSWFEPVYNSFLQDSGVAGLFADFAYDVNVYFIPMFGGLKKAAAGSAKKEVLDKIDSRLHPHILFYVGEVRSYRDALGLDERDQPYFFVLDEEGEIAYATEGAYTDHKMEEIKDILSRD